MFGMGSGQRIGVERINGNKHTRLAFKLFGDCWNYNFFAIHVSYHG